MVRPKKNPEPKEQANSKKEVVSQTIRLPKELVDKIEKYQIKHFHTTRHSAILSLINLGLHTDENR